MALALICCSRPSSREYFVMREDAEYGDTYSFNIDLTDSLLTYKLDFFTRLEMVPFQEMPHEDIVLDLRWFSSLGEILTDTLVVSLAGPAGDSYFSRDIITPYDNELIMGVPDEWRLNAKVVNDSEEIRGLGIILSQR